MAQASWLLIMNARFVMLGFTSAKLTAFKKPAITHLLAFTFSKFPPFILLSLFDLSMMNAQFMVTGFHFLALQR